MNNLITDGRITNIINALKSYYKVNEISELTTSQKLFGLTESIQLTNHQLDKLIAHTPQVLRTIKGHAFEVVFDIILKENGYDPKNTDPAKILAILSKQKGEMINFEEYQSNSYNNNYL